MTKWWFSKIRSRSAQVSKLHVVYIFQNVHDMCGLEALHKIVVHDQRVSYMYLEMRWHHIGISDITSELIDIIYWR